MSKILVVLPFPIGDIVMCHSLIRALQANGHKVGILANSYAKHLVQRMGVKIHTHDCGSGQIKIHHRYMVGNQLRSEKYDEAIIVHKSIKSAIIPVIARIPKRTGFLGEWRYFLINNLIKHKNFTRMIDEFCALAELKATLMPKLMICYDSSVLEKFYLSTDKPIICFCPFSREEISKRWPIESFVKLSFMLTAVGYQVWVFGSKKEMLEAKALEINQEVHNLCGITRLDEVTDLFYYPKYVVSNDTGLMHIAAAIDASVIAIYGSTSPEWAPPLNNKSVIYKSNIKCAPCKESICRYGHYQCLLDTSPEMIFRFITKQT